MTIEEAIKHCMDIAKESICTGSQDKCVKEHLQLAEWLEELKRLRVENRELKRDLGQFL